MKIYAVYVVCAAAVLALLSVCGCLGKEEDGPLTRSTQTEDSAKSQRAMEALAQPEVVETQADEYGLVELTASVKIPDYSLYFSQCWEEAAEWAKDEADFERRLFALAEEKAGGEEIQWTTREVLVDLSLADEEKKEWSGEELKEIARREAFEQEMREFALELVDEMAGRSIDWEAYAGAGEEAE